jgi:hypothetical protein
MKLEDIDRQFWELAKSLKEAQQAFHASNFNEAERLYKQALDLCEQTYGDDHSDTCHCLQNLSDTYFNLRKYKDAIPLLRRLLIAKQKVEAANAEVASILFKLAKTYEKAGQIGESEAFYRVAIKMGEQVYGNESTFVATVLESFMGMLRKAQIRLPEADQLEERVRDLRAKVGASGRDTANMVARLSDTISPGLGPPQEAVTSAVAREIANEQHNSGRMTSLRYRTETTFNRGGHSSGLNLSQILFGFLGIALLSFLGFCVYSVLTVKGGESPTAKFTSLVSLPAPFSDMGAKFTATVQPMLEQTPIFTSPDGQKEITLLDPEHALMTKHGMNRKASYRSVPPYITISPEGSTSTYTFERDGDTLKDPDGCILYSSSAPETTIINSMKTLASNATQYYRKFGRYPSKPDDLLSVVPVITYTNPFNHQPTWPTRRLLLGLDDTSSFMNVNDITNLQNAARQLEIWKASETIDPGTVEFYRIPGTVAGDDIFIIRGSDRSGHLLRASTTGLNDVIVCQKGRLRET